MNNNNDYNYNMGTKHSSKSLNKKRKIIVLTYEHYYMKKMHNFISQNDLPKVITKEFIHENTIYSEFEFDFWFLESTNRHLWRHHYEGTQGIILFFSFEEMNDNKVLIDVMNIFLDENLQEIPILIIFNSNAQNKKRELEQDLIIKLEKHPEIIHKIYETDLSKNIINIKEGIDWLCESMKPII